MAKDSQVVKLSTFTIRLEPELAERLRVSAFTARTKKQPLLRLAVDSLLGRENARPAAAVRKRWSALAAAQPPQTSMRETVRLSPEQDEALRRFCYDYRLHKQLVMRQALIEHLDTLDAATRRKR